ncbi:MAG: T9SS type A sorting domain-containing protein [Calditrichaeota bacterium]|nr:T9SS type A sorting domain-containing protein [Calditrichota bacterium]
MFHINDILNARRVALTLLFSAFVAMPLHAADWFALGSGGSSRAPDWNLLEESSGHLVVEVTHNGFYLERMSTSEGAFERISYTGRPPASRAALGSPELTAVTTMIRLPEGMTGRAEIVSAEWEEAGNHRIYPLQLPRRDGEPAPNFAYDPKVYASSEQLPSESVHLTQPQGWMGVPVASLGVVPLRYRPLDGALQVARRMVIRIEFEAANLPPLVRPRRLEPVMQKSLEAALVNPPSPDVRPLESDENEPVRTLVLVRESALETVMPLIDYYRNSGLRPEIWLIEGVPQPTTIKNRIRAMYEEGLLYVLFVGDAYPTNAQRIPQILWDQDDPGPQQGYSDAFSDSWYICLDPAVDGYDDHLPDLAIGRIPYDRDQWAQLSIQIAKSVEYRQWAFPQRDGGEWLDRSLLIAHKELYEEVYTYISCKEWIEGFNYRLDPPEFITAYGTSQQATNAFLRNTINGDGYGIVNYRGHGLATTWGDWNVNFEEWTTGSCTLLNNRNRPFILILSACYNNNLVRHNGTSMGEAFQRRPGGSVAVHGSTESTFTDGNTFFDETVFTAWFHHGIFDIGYAGNFAATQMVQEFDQHRFTMIGRFNLRSYTWLGDPALEYRHGRPREMVLEVSEIVPVGTESIEARVTAAGQGVEAVRVTARTIDDVSYVVSSTSQDGRVLLRFDPPLEGPAELIVAAVNRNDIPVIDTILIADGLGVVEGRVVAARDNRPVAGATATLSRFALRAVTDANGRYRMEGIPAGNYSLTATAPRWLPLSSEVEVVEEESRTVDFSMRYSELVIDRQAANGNVPAQSSIVLPMRITNRGDGPLGWTSSLNVPGDLAPLTRTEEFYFSLDVDDSRLHGAAMAGEHFYVAGGNNNADPNYIYVFDREGRYVRRFEQPQGAAGLGLRDLAWDGIYLYGVSQNTIYQMRTDGELIRSFASPFPGNFGIAVAGDGTIFVSDNNVQTRVSHLDRNGNEIVRFNTGLTVKGLAWNYEVPDGYNLFLYVRPAIGGIQLYAMHPNSGALRLIGSLPIEVGDTPIEGLELTTDYAPPYGLTLLGAVANEDLRRIQTWHLDYRRYWARVSPSQGSVPSGASADVSIILDAIRQRQGYELTGELILANDGVEPVVRVPVRMNVGPESIEDDLDSGIPNAFRLASVHPNPFNARLTVVVELPHAGQLRVGLFDLTGRSVGSAFESRVGPGQQTFAINGGGLASGVYILGVEFGSRRATQKVVLLR